MAQTYSFSNLCSKNSSPINFRIREIKLEKKPKGSRHRSEDKKLKGAKASKRLLKSINQQYQHKIMSKLNQLKGDIANPYESRRLIGQKHLKDQENGLKESDFSQKVLNNHHNYKTSHESSVTTSSIPPKVPVAFKIRKNSFTRKGPSVQRDL
ncbi:unnamed protein product [Moneuplotes crassus]|uniref:Uncharacterized protein n=1 Tax=Euplotes crassus TaxID=5936 RepID=A0AAD1XPI8_EUPCR|nr:unnamed protein product [Moneuplotes crassus]